MSRLVLLFGSLLLSHVFCAQTDKEFFRHLGQNNLLREQNAWLEKKRLSLPADSFSFYLTQYHFRNKNAEQINLSFPRALLLLKSDSSLLNSISFFMLTVRETERRGFFSSLAKPGTSYYTEQAQRFSDVVQQPGLADVSLMPDRLKTDFYALRKYHRRKPLLAALMSTVVPGLGKLYAGRRNSFFITLITHTIFGLRTYEAVKVLGIRHPFTWVNLALSGGFYLSNIYGSYLEVKKVREEKKKLFLIHASEYLTINCACAAQ